MPHGIAFSTDYKRLYVSNHDEEDAKWYQFDVVWDVDDDDGDDESITSKNERRRKRKKRNVKAVLANMNIHKQKLKFQMDSR